MYTLKSILYTLKKTKPKYFTALDLEYLKTVAPEYDSWSVYNIDPTLSLRTRRVSGSFDEPWLVHGTSLLPNQKMWLEVLKDGIVVSALPGASLDQINPTFSIPKPIVTKDNNGDFICDWRESETHLFRVTQALNFPHEEYSPTKEVKIIKAKLWEKIQHENIKP